MISKITKNLYIGEYSDVIGQTLEETKDRLKQISALEIEHVLSLCSEGVESCQIENEAKAFRTIPRGKTKIQLHHLPVPVSVNVAGQHDPYKVGFALAVKEIYGIIFNDSEAKILIHCTAGIDRSPFLVAFYLARSRHLDIADAYREIKKIRPCIIEHLEWT